MPVRPDAMFLPSIIRAATFLPLVIRSKAALMQGSIRHPANYMSVNFRVSAVAMLIPIRLHVIFLPSILRILLAFSLQPSIVNH